MLFRKLFLFKKILENSFSLKINQKVILSHLIEWLEKMGYSRQTNVYSIGEYALRGGILDIFVPEIKYPIRLDFLVQIRKNKNLLIHQVKGQMGL